MGHSIDLGSCTDSCLHTPMRAHPPCSCVVKSENFRINNMAKTALLLIKTAPLAVQVDYCQLLCESFKYLHHASWIIRQFHFYNLFVRL